MREARSFGFECRTELRDLPIPRSANRHGRRQSRQPDHSRKFQVRSSKCPTRHASTPALTGGMRTHARSAVFRVRMQDGASRPVDPAQRKLAWPQAIPPARPLTEVPCGKFQVPKEARVHPNAHWRDESRHRGDVETGTGACRTRERAWRDSDSARLGAPAESSTAKRIACGAS